MRELKNYIAGEWRASNKTFEKRSPFNGEVVATVHEATREMVDESKKWFVGLVAKRRDLDPDSVPGLTDGRIYSGREALKLKLIDQIGGEDDAIAWLEKNRDVPKKLRVIDWKSGETRGLGWFRSAVKHVASWAGLPVAVVDSILGPGSALERVRLDGLVSVWHAQQD